MNHVDGFTESLGRHGLVHAKVTVLIVWHRPGALFHTNGLYPQGWVLGMVTIRADGPEWIWPEQWGTYRRYDVVSATLILGSMAGRNSGGGKDLEISESWLRHTCIIYIIPHFFVILWGLTKGRLRSLPIGKSTHRRESAKGPARECAPADNRLP